MSIEKYVTTRTLCIVSVVDMFCDNCYNNCDMQVLQVLENFVHFADLPFFL